MQRAAGPLEYVMGHVYLRHTLSSPPGFSRPGLQAANGFELGFQGNLEGIKHDRFDLFFVHRVLLSGCCKGGYDRQVGMSTKIITYLRKMSKLQTPLHGRGSNKLQFTLPSPPSGEEDEGLISLH